VSAQIGSGGSLLDLYGGAGNLSLGLSDRFAEIHTVDLGAPIRTPDGAAPHHRFHRTSVLDWLRREQDRLRKGGPLRLVLDPPREGLGPELFAIVEVLKGLPLAETLLIGCETDPWANALARFQKHGWKLERLGALDFFPQTHHVEALAVLRRA
jgi:tRNA/tmRNA/rRNA uracil-C5-methylase (TrmA/RlmC/RlmD family)